MLRFVFRFVIVAIALAELSVVFWFGDVALVDRLGAYFGLVGAYGLAIGFFGRVPALNRLAPRLVHPDPAMGFSANCLFCVMLMQLATAGLSPRLTKGAPLIVSTIGMLLWPPAFIMLLVYMVFHMLVVVPLAYFPILVSCALISRVKYAASGFDVSVMGETVDVASLVKTEGAAALPGPVMAIPALTLSVVSLVVKLFLGG